MSPPNACRTARLLVGALSVIAAAAWSAAAYAQEPAPVPPEAAAPPAAAAMPPGQQPPPPPAQPMPPPPPPVMTRTPEPEIPAAHSESDLDVEARRFAIGYSGVSQVPTGTGHAGRTGDRPALLGHPDARHRRRGRFRLAGRIDGRVGHEHGQGQRLRLRAAGRACRSRSSTHRHVSFQVIPFVTFAHGQTSTSIGGLRRPDFSGMRFEVGARTGFEVFFGFIGIPELALSATVGAAVRDAQEQRRRAVA